MIPALSQVCSLNAPLDEDIADYAAGACGAIELWLGKLETYLERHSLDDVRRLADEHRIALPAAAYQGGLLVSQGESRREHWSHFARRLAICRDLGVGTLVVACDLMGPLAQQDLERTQVSLGQAAQLAGEHGVRLALEFQAAASFGNNLQTAAALVAECGSPQLGLCLDAFHYYTGPSKPEDLEYLTVDNLFHVQLCDLAGVARELAADSDRVLPGDGDIFLGPIVDRLRSIDYRGAVSIELMNPQLWAISPRQFGEIAMTALRNVLGLASMG
ncbi:MAG TPA: sugar phosphate isomerase/epimerase [Pirellulales bacterium]|nr:sugar phosphate isomerase/epimerase [Pirellulales bacterium]